MNSECDRARARVVRAAKRWHIEAMRGFGGGFELDILSLEVSRLKAAERAERRAQAASRRREKKRER